jgi:hypothetical protein
MAFTCHLISSLAWLGAVASFLLLSISAIRSHDTEISKAAYVLMNRLGLYLILPLCLGSLITGIYLSLSTRWGLIRYYWVATKFVLTIVATIALVLHQFTAVARAAKLATSPFGDLFPIHELDDIGTQLVADSSLAIVLLFVATVLAIYKPWGLTGYGKSTKSQETSITIISENAATPKSLKTFLAILAVLVVLFLLLHLASGGLGHHAH